MWQENSDCFKELEKKLLEKESEIAHLKTRLDNEDELQKELNERQIIDKEREIPKLKARLCNNDVQDKLSEVEKQLSEERKKNSRLEGRVETLFSMLQVLGRE